MDLEVVTNNKRDIEPYKNVKICENIIRIFGTWFPLGSMVFYIYAFVSFSVVIAINIVSEICNLIIVLGNVPQMVSTGLLLLTNAAHALKVYYD